MKKIISFTYYFLVLFVSGFFIYKAVSNAILSSGDLWIITKFSEFLFDGTNIFFQNRILSPTSHLGEIKNEIWYAFSLISLISTFFIIFYLRKIFDLDNIRTAFLSLIIFSCTPFTNTFGNGQVGLVVLLFLIIYWFNLSRFSNFFLIVLGFKISFSAFFLAFIFFKRFKSFIFFSIFYLVCFALCVYLSKAYDPYEIFQVAISPLSSVLAGENVSNFDFEGHFNLRYIFKLFNINEYYFVATIILYLIGIVGIFFIKDLTILFLYLCNLTLIIFYHWIYDFVFLIPLAAYILKDRPKNIFFDIPNCFMIFFVFYFFRINQLIFNNFFDEILLNLIGFVLLLYSTFSLIYLDKINKILK